MSDAQLIVSSDVAALLDRYATGQPGGAADSEREAIDLLEENGFLVEDRAADRRSLDEFFTSFRRDTSVLGVMVLTTLQCNFACDYCFQGDHGDYNKFAEKATTEGGFCEEMHIFRHAAPATFRFWGGVRARCSAPSDCRYPSGFPWSKRQNRVYERQRRQQ